MVLLPEEPPSWTYVLDNLRIETKQTPTEVAQEQLRVWVPLLGGAPLGLGDRGYGNAAFVLATRDIPCDGLLRISRDRVFYRAAPPPTGKRGAPKKDGSRFKCSDPSPHGVPDSVWEGVASKGGRVEVARGNDLPFKQCRDPTVSLLRVIRHGAKDSKRDPKGSGFIGVKRTELPEPPLSEVPSLYARRFSHEHGYRFDKTSLLWGNPRLRTPEQFQRGTDLVTLAHDQLLLARPLVDAQRQPWESPNRGTTPNRFGEAWGDYFVSWEPRPAPSNLAENPRDALRGECFTSVEEGRVSRR